MHSLNFSYMVELKNLSRYDLVSNSSLAVLDVKAGKVVVEETNIPAKTIKHGRNHHSPIFLKLDKVEEETALEISNMELDLIDLPKKFLSLEKKESAAEEFKFQSAATTDIDGLERIHDIEHLKSALVAERKVLNALYAELAAERSAAATAANQTINMITKLQEEKASMQMEALQYQQMMEEQSEYDQEALKLLNELMVKREKEKQELEKELEIYRKRVYLYEEKERRVLRRRSTNEKSTTPSTSSNSEDSDNANDRQESGKEATTPGDTIQNLDDIGLESSRQLSTLDESLVDFEEERMAILEQLKALEEKLFALDDNEDEGGLFEDLRTIESFSAESNGCFNENYEFHSAETNGFSNGHCKSVVGENGQAKRNIDDNAKKLLPLFDAIGMENEDEISLKEEQKCAVPLTKQDSMNSHCTDYNNKLEEEIDHVYQRLQALEADREFLKHCVISLKKGDKGMDLLEEILQHLRDLKNVELRAQKTCDALLL
ncbi:hypothetical protein Scep_016156 [Stephania cephalantha]|uniref:GTD-binding domain-containing protein n=1 Tax=Stephania cephalantha TaxID=152367 RepID=A0AAP0IM28_9MAGN